ncbi:SDR family NAD(P)-dependent oxidoreductase [Chloroflexota bacterium]
MKQKEKVKEMGFGLAGKTVIVTGGASNIGHGIVMAFAKEGSNVVIADIDKAQAQKTAGLARKLGVRALVVTADVTKPKQCEAIVKKALDKFGQIDVLVNNAGGTRGHLAYTREISRDIALMVMDLNFWSQFDCTRAVVEHMISRKSGRIVNISSGAGLGGAHSRYPIYAAAKAAVISLTRSLSEELLPFGINVNSVAPGLILPDQRNEQVGEMSAHYKPSPEHAKLMDSGLAGRPADIANMVVFLASDAAGYISGQTFYVYNTSNM